MNSYVALMLEAEGAKDRLQRLFQSTPEVKKNGSVAPAFNQIVAQLGTVPYKLGTDALGRQSPRA
jgi:hypothetical protein